MPVMQFSSIVRASPERVFDAAADFANAAGRLTGIKRIELLTPGPVAVGTKFRETRVIFGKEATETMEVTRFDRPRGYTLTCASCGVEWNSTFTFSHEGDRTRLALECRSRSLTLFAKIMSPLGALMAASMRKLIQKDIDDLTAYVESLEPSLTQPSR